MFQNVLAWFKTNAILLAAVAALAAYNYYLSNEVEVSNLKIESLTTKVIVQDSTIKRLDKQVGIEVDTAMNFRLGTGLVVDSAKKIEADRNAQIEEINRDQSRTQTERERAISKVEIRSLWNSYCLSATDAKCTEPPK